MGSKPGKTLKESLQVRLWNLRRLQITIIIVISQKSISLFKTIYITFYRKHTKVIRMRDVLRFSVRAWRVYTGKGHTMRLLHFKLEYYFN